MLPILYAVFTFPNRPTSPKEKKHVICICVRTLFTDLATNDEILEIDNPTHPLDNATHETRSTRLHIDGNMTAPNKCDA